MLCDVKKEREPAFYLFQACRLAALLCPRAMALGSRIMYIHAPMGRTAALKKPRNWRPWVDAGVAATFQHRGVILLFRGGCVYYATSKGLSIWLWDWISLLCDGKLLVVVVVVVLFLYVYLLYGRNPAGTLCSKSILSREPYSRRKPY